MDVLEAIHTRRSVRKYLDKPVEWDKIGTILDAGRMAPTAGNLQPYRFIVVNDPGKIKLIAEACSQQYWIEGAPVLILIVIWLKKVKEFYGERGVDVYAVQDAAVAAQNMMLAAHSLGIGSCQIGMARFVMDEKDL